MTTDPVVPLRGAYEGPCCEVSKLRSIPEPGKLVFDRWCYKHHHWLNDAPPQRTVMDELLESIK